MQFLLFFFSLCILDRFAGAAATATGRRVSSRVVTDRRAALRLDSAGRPELIRARRCVCAIRCRY